MLRVRLKGDIKKEFAELLKPRVAKKIAQLIDDLKVATPVDTGKARDGWRRSGNSIVNDVEYIDDLNQGHSPQASAHFVEATVLKDRAVHPNGTIVRNTR
ncbi:hypothetical protein [EBPR siphovirus 1]|nr:hypothetical protein [EBPR siphovirus 1]